jgi:hypothetical protein
MRVLALTLLIIFAACSDPVRVESLAVNPDGSFAFTAQTNTVMTANDDGEAEQLRSDWLGEELTARGLCGAGYVVETRLLTGLPEAPASNAHDVVYTGRCL